MEYRIIARTAVMELVSGLKKFGVWDKYKAHMHEYHKLKSCSDGDVLHYLYIVANAIFAITASNIHNRTRTSTWDVETMKEYILYRFDTLAISFDWECYGYDEWNEIHRLLRDKIETKVLIKLMKMKYINSIRISNELERQQGGVVPDRIIVYR